MRAARERNRDRDRDRDRDRQRERQRQSAVVHNTIANAKRDRIVPATNAADAGFYRP